MTRLQQGVLFILVFAATAICGAETIVSGNITTTTWTASNSPYRVTAALTVPNGNTLTIEAGVDVLFDADVRFVVEGALRVHGSETDSVRFMKGTASEWGGISISGDDSSFFSYTRISDGNAHETPFWDGGGVFCEGPHIYLNMEHCVVSGNRAKYKGGGIAMNFFCELLLSYCTITGNHASQGGGVASYLSNVTLISCNIAGNTSDHEGGGLYIRTSERISMTRCVIENNTASSSGGGIFNRSSEISAIGCLIQGNRSSTDGGGLRNHDATSTLRHCAIVNNSAVRYGGGVCNSGNSTANLENCTTCGNSSTKGGGLLNEGGATSTLTYCIFWENAPQSISNEISTATATYSCIEGGYTGTGNISVDPLFVDAANHNYQLSSLSPCWNQDGNGRNMGAFPFAVGEISDLTIITSTTWTTADSPYHIRNTTIIPAGNRLVIQAGVDVVFDADVQFIVEGAISANGTESDSVRFIAGEVDEWGGIRIYDGYNSFQYTRISNGNADGESWQDKRGGGVYCTGSSTQLVMNYCMISDNHAFYGGGVSSCYAKPTFVNCIVRGNSALNDGGCFFNDCNSLAEFWKCTIADNKVTGDGASIANAFSSSANLNTCILWENSLEEVSGDATVTYSCIQGGYTGSGNTSADPLFTDAENGDFSLQVESPCVDAGDPSLTDADGSRSDMGAFAYAHPSSIETGRPLTFTLSQNMPNPFNPATTIPYSVATAGPVSLNIYNLQGQLVKTLVQQTAAPGEYHAMWNGRDMADRAVASGVYVYRLSAPDGVRTKRMLLVR